MFYAKTHNNIVTGVGTPIVLAKCACDQIFFATQQDGLFLALCAYEDKERLSQAIEEVKRNFLTTWISDCAVWPVVNFFGFAFVPFKFQPAYMAGVQFFWQLYISSMAAEATPVENHDDAIEMEFKSLDADNVSVNDYF